MPFSRRRSASREQCTGLSEAKARDDVLGKQALGAHEAALDKADRVLERLAQDGNVVIFEAPMPIFEPQLSEVRIGFTDAIRFACPA
jgi:hypothetical protein